MTTLDGLDAAASTRAAEAPASDTGGVRHPLVRSTARRRMRGFAAVVAPVIAAALLLGALGIATVRHDSMEPTLRNGDVVLYDRWATPSRGDIVLLVDREGWSGEPDALLVKRIVGVAGDVVVCCEAGSGRLLVNDLPVDEPYVADGRPGGGIPFRVTVPDDAVWVMGDHRDASADSRATVAEPGHGAVSRADLRGTVRAWWGG